MVEFLERGPIYWHEHVHPPPNPSNLWQVMSGSQSSFPAQYQTPANITFAQSVCGPAIARVTRTESMKRASDKAKRTVETDLGVNA